MGSLLPLLNRVWLSPGALTATLSTMSLQIGKCEGRRRGEPGSPLVDLLRNGKFAAVAEPGLAIARSIDGHAEHDVVARDGIGRDLEVDLVDADQVRGDPRVDHAGAKTVDADDHLAEDERVGADVRKRAGHRRRRHRPETGDIYQYHVTGARRILQADEAAIRPDSHGAARVVAHDGLEDAGGGGRSEEH